MATTVQGVDVVTRVVDQTAAGAASVKRSMASMGKDTEDSLARAGKQWSNGLAGAMISGLAASGIDRALEQIIEGVNVGQTGTQIGLTIGQSIVDALRSVPVAGAIGQAMTSMSPSAWLIGFQGRRDKQQQDGERRQAGQDQADDNQQRIRDRLRDDTITDEERKRKEFDQQLGPALRGARPSDQKRVAEELRKEFEDRQARDAMRLADEQRRKMAEEQQQAQQREQQRREADDRRASERREREMERERMDAARAASDRSRAIAAASDSLATGQSSRFSTGRNEAFLARNGSQSEAHRLARRQIDLLERVLEEARQQRQILQEAAS